ncbi:MAG: type VI secretion system-associated protein [Gammaproteobacteria bacterium RIFCSPHIGHO2_12_FULL_45_9]|nr:MAG: type VI secretion system-associated protein [Gammaproteobacteria bacterium RIFCSPHIGHO2_12_FULL_45_9]
MAESTQHKLDRVRTPRVQITYDVETGGAVEKKELPFVVGVMADLSGKPVEALAKLKDRRFVEIDRDNFDKILDSAKPRVAYRVKNRLQGKEGENEELNVELKFTQMDDFNPGKLVQQVPALRKLYEARERLKDLLAKLDGNDALDEVLQSITSDPAKLEELKKSGLKDEAEEKTE